jgi:hypothetical protein
MYLLYWLAAQQGVPVIGLLGVVLLPRTPNTRFDSLILSARALLDQIERDAGMYLERNLKEAALKTVGE